MVKSMFAGVAGLRAHQTKMDVIGNNIANVNTYSFKASRATFRDAFYQTLTSSSEAGGGMGGRNPSQIGYGSEIGNISVLYTRGAFAPTDSPSDMMIMGQGYFLVGPANAAGYTADGTDGLTDLNLTRVGMFEFDGSGNLVDPFGNMVYGYPTTAPGATPPVTPVLPTTKLMPIRLPQADGTAPPAIGTAYTPMKMEGIAFGADGTVTGKGPDGKVYTVGKIAVANVPNQSALNMTQSSYYKAGSNTGDVTAHVPGTGTTGSIRAGGLEMANVDLSKEFSEMITTQRGFQANTRIITVTDEMLQELVNLKR